MLAAVVWGTNYAATKYAAEFIPPLLIVGIRFTVGGLLMLGLLQILEPASKLATKDLLPVAGLGCLGVAIDQTAFTFGVSLTSAANTGLIFATAPVWGLLLSSMLGLERPTPRGILGVGLSILGVGIVFYEGLGAEGASLGGGGLLGHLRYGLRLLGLANGNLAHRSQQGTGLPVLDNRYGGRIGHRLLWRGTRDREADRRGGHTRGRVPGPAPVIQMSVAITS
jgi:drug/metabolite transporter (DMT)-like permease